VLATGIGDPVEDDDLFNFVPDFDVPRDRLYVVIGLDRCFPPEFAGSEATLVLVGHEVGELKLGWTLAHLLLRLESRLHAVAL
jgi:hypothetical protein